MFGSRPLMKWWFQSPCISFIHCIQRESQVARLLNGKPLDFRSSHIGQRATTQGMNHEDELLDEEDQYSKTVSSTWNIPGLKAEVNRQILRSHKKISKVASRVQNAQTTIQYLRSHDNVTQEELEACPNVLVYENELKELQERLEKLNQLDRELQIYKNHSQETLPQSLVNLAIELECRDEPPSRSMRGQTKKEKGPKAHEVKRRKPYKRYYTVNKTEIRVRNESVILLMFD